MMSILKEIKIGRLILATLITLVIADTLPHPGLSSGLLETVLSHSRPESNAVKPLETAIANPTF